MLCSPQQIIQAIVKGMQTYNSENCLFYEYKYGTTVTIDAMYKATFHFDEIDYNPIISPYLYEWEYEDESTPAYAIIHNKTIPWDSSEVCLDILCTEKQMYPPHPRRALFLWEQIARGRGLRASYKKKKSRVASLCSLVGRALA